MLQIRLALQSLDPPWFPGSVHVQARVEAVDDVRPDGGAAPGVDSGQRAGGSQISKHRLKVCFGILYLGRIMIIVYWYFSCRYETKPVMEVAFANKMEFVTSMMDLTER